MKKISNLELSSIIIIQVVTMFSGINITILKEGSDINSWLSALLLYILGFIPLLLILYISNYKKDQNLHQKINSLFGKILGTIINIIISIILISLGITILYNIINFILSQLLYRTPFLISCILFMLLIIYNTNKGINVITKTSLLLLMLNIGLYTINIFALYKQVDITNFYPLLKINTNNIIPTTLKLFSINMLPLLLILMIPKEQIDNPKKYNKTIIISYIIGALISLSLVVVTFGVLGINLIKAFEYPGYIVLRKIELLGFLERIENVISLQWIVGSFVYLSLIIYTISKSIPLKSIKKHKYLNIIIGTIFIILTKSIFKNNTIFDTYIIKIFPYITSILSLVYIIIPIKILFRKNKIITNKT